MESPNGIDRKLFAAVDRLGNAVRVARQRLAVSHGLSSLQVQVVELLGEAQDRPRRVGSIAAELGVSSPTVSDAVSSLEAKGAVERTNDPADRRATIVELTESGTALADEIMQLLGPIMDATREIPLGDRGTALAVMLEMINSLYRAGIISIDRSCLTCQHFQRDTGLGAARCGLLGIELATHNLRVKCDEHVPA